VARGSAAHAASFDLSGFLQADNLTGIPWVIALNPPQPEGQGFMWGTIQTGSGAGTSQSGFHLI
jgi:hypothetical protein